MLENRESRSNLQWRIIIEAFNLACRAEENKENLITVYNRKNKESYDP